MTTGSAEFCSCFSSRFTSNQQFLLTETGDYTRGWMNEWKCWSLAVSFFFGLKTDRIDSLEEEINWIEFSHKKCVSEFSSAGPSAKFGEENRNCKIKSSRKHARTLNCFENPIRTIRVRAENKNAIPDLSLNEKFYQKSGWRFTDEFPST